MAISVDPVVTSDGMRPIDFPDTNAPIFNKTEFLDDGRREPLFPTVARAITVAAPRLDPTRVDLLPDTASPKWKIWRGPIGSLLLHVIPLLLLMDGLRPSLDIPAAIPVQLVIEQPPPPPDPPPEKQAVPAEPPPGLRASEDMGEVGPPTAHLTPPAQGEQSPPTAGALPPEPPVAPAGAVTALAEPAPRDAPAEVASVTVPSEPAPAPPAEPSLPLAQSQAAPTPPDSPAAPPPAVPALVLPAPAKPAPPKQQLALLEGLQLPLPLHSTPHHASASAQYPGPNASRDEYCVYALHLTLQHIDLLPRSMLGARRGDTVVAIRLRDDGSIVYARVQRGSGYLDIDERIAEMVRAVGKFPPFPLWLSGPTSDFTLAMHFPNPAQR